MWIFKTYHELFYIENTSKTKVLQATSNGKVIQEVFVEGKAEQLWKKGQPDAEDYFSLESSKSSKILTATSSSNLEVLGNQIVHNYIIFVYFFIVLLCYQQIANKYGQERRLLMAFILSQFDMVIQQSF